MPDAATGSGGRAEQPQTASTLPAPTYCTHCGQPILAKLRNSAWAKERLGFTGELAGTFWQFVKSNRAPFVRLGPRTLRFDENTLNEWIAARAKGGAV